MDEVDTRTGFRYLATQLWTEMTAGCTAMSTSDSQNADSCYASF